MYEDDIVAKAVKWTLKAREAIEEAGGNGDAVLKNFSEESLNTMVRNNLHLVYRRD